MVGEPRTVAGRFRTTQEIAVDDHREVWLAHDLEEDDEVILVLFRALDPDDSDRIERDSSTLASLTHPNITSTRAHGSEGTDLYIAFARPEGQGLVDVMKSGLGPERAALIKEQVVVALQHASEAGLELAPVGIENVVVAEGDRVQVTLAISLPEEDEPVATDRINEARVSARLASALMTLDEIATQNSGPLAVEEEQSPSVWPIPGRRYDPERLGRRVILVIALIAAIAFTAFFWRITSRNDEGSEPSPTPAATLSSVVHPPEILLEGIGLGVSGVPS